MKPSLIKILSLFILWGFSFPLAAQDEDDHSLKKKITLHVKDQSRGNVLDEISRNAGISFSYDPSILNTDQLISADCDSTATEQILETILGDEFRITMLGDQCIITLKKAGDPQLANLPVSVSSDVLRISGVITDAESGDVIPYASVSVMNEPFGTISNKDGVYELKIPKNYQESTIVFSCMGFIQMLLDPHTLKGETVDVELQPFNVRIGEVVVSAVNPVTVLDHFEERIFENYPDEIRLMTSFYREVLMQDRTYVNVSEAVIQILKSAYDQTSREDRIRFLKGRKSPDVQPFKWVDFKMQGGPFYMTKLDVVRTMDTFLDKEYRRFYKYELDYLIDYFGRPTYIILFEPDGKIDFPCYEGRLFIDRETYALVHAEFSLSKDGMKYARKSLIRKKPKGFNVRPLDLDYRVTYRNNDGRWSLGTAQTSARFRVRSRNDKINSVFHSVSDLLVTNHERTALKRFDKDETFLPTDIFTEMIIDYDKEFWGDFNIIQPDDDLRKALKDINTKGGTMKSDTSQPDQKLQTK
ncbi:MAG: carboxypeptidase-like regulatory domain-containing protein [Mangrovibacterium sp.]|nr:carboxypeptidase-like regulatory domain-containing protein [Mangrovibacterium sp.]